MNSFIGKVAIVTGGGSGIGRATALGFVANGAKVIIADLSVKSGQRTADIVKQLGGEAVFIRADVTKANEVKELISKTVEIFGRLDYASNSAGIAGPVSTLADYPEDQWDMVIDINLKGVWLCMKYELPHMLKQGGGTIVNTSSILGLIAMANSPAYNASKHGVAGLTKTAAIEYGRDNIRVNAVCPGVIHSPMVDEDHDFDYSELLTKHPIGRFGKTEEVANAVIWLSSDAASFVTGHTMLVDGGYVAA